MTTARVVTPHVPDWVDGGLFPTGDEARLRALATAWSTQGTQSDEQAEELGLTFRSGARSHAGDVAEAAAAHVSQVRGFISSTGSGCTSLGSACSDAATTVEYAKTATNVALLELETRSQELLAQPSDGPVDAVATTLKLRQMQIATALQIRAIHTTAKASMSAISVEVDIQPALTVPPDTRSPYVPNTPGTLFNRERVERVADTGQFPMPVGAAGESGDSTNPFGEGEEGTEPQTDGEGDGDGTGETAPEGEEGSLLTELFDPRTLVGGADPDQDGTPDVSATDAAPVDDTEPGTGATETVIDEGPDTTDRAGSPHDPAGETTTPADNQTDTEPDPAAADTGRSPERPDRTPPVPRPADAEPPARPTPPAPSNPTQPAQPTPTQPIPEQPPPAQPAPVQPTPERPAPVQPTPPPAPTRGPDPTWTPPTESAPPEVTNPGTGAAGTAPIVDRPAAPLPGNPAPTGGLGGGPSGGFGQQPLGGTPVGGAPVGGAPVGGAPVGGAPVGGGGSLGSPVGGGHPVPSAPPSQPVAHPNPPAQPPAAQPQQPQPPQPAQPQQPQHPQAPSQSRPAPIPADPLRPTPEERTPAPEDPDPTSQAAAPAVATALPVSALGLAPLLADLRRSPDAAPRRTGSVLPTQFGPGDVPLAALPVTVRTAYQKVLLPGEAEAMLAGQVRVLRGLLHLHDQVGDLTSPREIHDLLGLGFAVRDARGQLQRAFDLAMSSVDVLRCAGIRDCDLVVPVAPDVAASDGAVVNPGSAIAPMTRHHARPWTGSGLAPGSTEDRVIEEFELLAEVGLPIPHLAEIWRFHEDGRVEHLGTHNARNGAWQGIPTTDAVHGEPVALGPQAVLGDGSRWPTVVLNDREAVLIDRSGALPPGFTEAADRSGRRIAELPVIASFVRTATTALWHGARMLVLATSGTHVLIDFVDEFPDAATGLGFVQLGQGQWQQRWVPGTELTGWQTWERTYPQGPPAPAGTG